LSRQPTLPRVRDDAENGHDPGWIHDSRQNLLDLFPRFIKPLPNMALQVGHGLLRLHPSQDKPVEIHLDVARVLSQSLEEVPDTPWLHRQLLETPAGLPVPVAVDAHLRKLLWDAIPLRFIVHLHHPTASLPSLHGR